MELCSETSKNEVPKPWDLLDLVGRIFLSRGCKVWGSNLSIFELFNFFWLRNLILEVQGGFGMVLSMSR